MPQKMVTVGTRQALSSLIVCAITCLPIQVYSEDWPNYRGPSHNGISKETDWTNQWPDSGPPIVWRTNVGIGFSSMAVSRGHLFTLGNNQDEESLYCIDTLTGAIRWKHTYECAIDDRFFEGGPTSTPTVDQDVVYSLSRNGDLFCVEIASGKVRWSKNIQQETNVRIPGWGFAASPLIHADRLILGVGEAGMALNKNDGSLLWKSGDGEAGYMTPFPFQMGDRWFALIASGKFYHCVDLDSGTVAWRHRWLTTYGCNAAAPIVDGSRAFLSSGYGRGATLLKVSLEAAEVIWANKEMQNQLNSSVLIGESLFGFDGDEGAEVQLKCLDFATGVTKWSYAGLGAGSLTATKDRLIVLSQSGELLVAPVSSSGFQPTSRAKVLDGKCWTVPVLSDGKIYCRNAAGDLVCLDVLSPTKE
jgi:outer membrane protein assembly factor BamB